MQPREKDCLLDVLRAGSAITRFTKRTDFARYQNDELLRSAVERQFMIIGEALVRLRDVDNEWMERILDARRIIGFRNVLVHGYDALSDDRVWDAIQVNLPALMQLVRDLLGEG